MFCSEINRQTDRHKKERVMAGGGLTNGGPGKRAHLYEHKFTAYFAFTCVVGALGGSLFGYDLGVSGILILPSIQFNWCFYEYESKNISSTLV